MSIPAHANLPDVLEALLEAEAEFVRLLLDAAPLPEGSTKDPEYLELVMRYEHYMPSSEVTAIVRFLYMLDTYGVTNEEALRRLVAAHNERMVALAADTAYLTRMGIPKARLLDARFPDGATNHAVMNFTYHRRVALDATAMGRLLVEFANKHQIAEAMTLLARLGFFEVVPGAFAAKVFLSDGRLEAIYRDYLARVAQGVSAALGGPGKEA